MCSKISANNLSFDNCIKELMKNHLLEKRDPACKLTDQEYLQTPMMEDQALSDLTKKIKKFLKNLGIDETLFKLGRTFNITNPFAQLLEYMFQLSEAKYLTPAKIPGSLTMDELIEIRELYSTALLSVLKTEDNPANKMMYSAKMKEYQQKTNCVCTTTFLESNDMIDSALDYLKASADLQPVEWALFAEILKGKFLDEFQPAFRNYSMNALERYLKDNNLYHLWNNHKENLLSGRDPTPRVEGTGLTKEEVSFVFDKIASLEKIECNPSETHFTKGAAVHKEIAPYLKRFLRRPESSFSSCNEEEHADNDFTIDNINTKRRLEYSIFFNEFKKEITRAYRATALNDSES